MAAIKGKDTSIELLLRKALFGSGYRFRIHCKLPGKPDIVFVKKRKAVFVHGCFWHQHENCKLAYMPKSNITFWETKLLKNVERDKQTRTKLQKDGWKVITVWECEIENELEETVLKVIKGIK